MFHGETRRIIDIAIDVVTRSDSWLSCTVFLKLLAIYNGGLLTVPAFSDGD